MALFLNNFSVHLNDSGVHLNRYDMVILNKN